MAQIMLPLLLLLLLIMLIWHKFEFTAKCQFDTNFEAELDIFFLFLRFLSEQQQPQQPKSAPDDLHICERGRERISWFLELKSKLRFVENVFRFQVRIFINEDLLETADKLKDYRMFLFKFVLH